MNDASNPVAVVANRHYAHAMKLQDLIPTIFFLTSTAALACSPAPAGPGLSHTEISRATKDALQRSDVIVDAQVVQLSNGIIALKPFKIWKGVRRRSYYIGNLTCGVDLTKGSRVRALLVSDGRNWFTMTEPLQDSRFDTSIFNSIVDAHLGKIRPKDFTDGGPDLQIPPDQPD